MRFMGGDVEKERLCRIALFAQPPGCFIHNDVAEPAFDLAYRNPVSYRLPGIRRAVERIMRGPHPVVESLVARPGFVHFLLLENGQMPFTNKTGGVSAVFQEFGYGDLPGSKIDRAALNGKKAH